ncbi:MAG TPA: flavodoxin [Desulfitobacteriaceae bacterium]|nr:flavodoxin [Desulfitobacteriaceae bacterium]
MSTAEIEEIEAVLRKYPNICPTIANMRINLWIKIKEEIHTMKKISALVLAIMVGLFLATCGCINSDTTGSDNNSTVQERQSSTLDENEQIESKVKSNNTSGTKENNILVAYFSHSGNTRIIANQIHEKVGGDIFEIVTVNPYPKDYDAVVDQAKQEQEDNYRPELATEVENMDSYDVVFIGYPNWWGTMPMPVFTFLEEYKFSGKTIIPFCTHEGSGLGRSVEDITELCPQSTILDGLAIRGSSVETAQDDVSEWLREIGMAE